jgi:hypothetical protein
LRETLLFRPPFDSENLIFVFWMARNGQVLKGSVTILDVQDLRMLYQPVENESLENLKNRWDKIA